jgi:hypothetical protein
MSLVEHLAGSRQIALSQADLAQLVECLASHVRQGSDGAAIATPNATELYTP